MRRPPTREREAEATGRRRRTPVARPAHLRAERALWRSGVVRVAGVDEVGVGSLCGPVMAAAVVLTPEHKRLRGVRDSKTLSPDQRERLAPEIRQRAVAIGLGAASVDEILHLNILRASHLAMRRALSRVGGYDHALVDGRDVTDVDLGPHTAIIDGDASSYAIACASIVAKVTRDHLMAKLALRYPGYGWEHNAGYRTREHITALKERGLTIFHRAAYAPVRALLASEQLELTLPEAALVDEMAL